MSLLFYVLLTFSAFFTAMISATVGMAGGIVLLSIMTFFMDLSMIVPIHGIVQMASNTTRTYKLKQYIVKPIFLYSAIGLPVGTFISTQIIKSISNKEVLYFLIAGLIFYTIFKPKKLPSLKIPYWGFGPLSIIVGILNPLIGATGPFMAPFYLRDDLTKEEIVATKAIVQAYGHLLKIPAFLYLGFDYLAFVPLILLMITGVFFGTHYGVKVLHAIDEIMFRRIFKTALFLAACRVCYKAWMSF
jgi:uncharacterized protein